jgi:hypothetical protein
MGEITSDSIELLKKIYKSEDKIKEELDEIADTLWNIATLMEERE